MYDWTHGESDYIEQVSHSLCSLEFKPHRKLYNWFRDQVFEYGKDKYPSLPNQTEFARLNLSYTIMSKRKLLTLVEANVVKGWDDPRMPTISGLRRRGYTPNSIRTFVETVGVAKRENIIDVSLLEFCVRQDLNKKAQRVMAVLDPVKLVINNYVENKEELFEADNNPEEQNAGSHQVPFSRELYIEREDFKENAGGKFFRLTLGGEVRLKNAYIIKGNSVVKDAEGKIMEVHCTYDPESLSGSGSQASLRKVKGTLHWVSIKHAIKAEVRVYDRLFNDEAPDSHKDKSFMDFVNPNSLTVSEAFIEPFLGKAKPGESFQFQRLGYFNVDKDSSPEQLVFNKTVGLRDSWTKKKPVQNNPKQVNLGQSSNRPPIEIIKQFGKKYTNLPPEKQEKIRAEIQELAKNVSYEDLQPLFATAAKKAGTRTVAMISLGVLLANGQQKTQEAQEFINRGVDDKNALLVAEAKILC
jgi:glutaminyl-tRNA synthetase